MGDHKRKRTLGPPPRWLHCPRKGTIIVDKFIAFKTPLDTSYDSQVPLECSFNPSMIIGSLSNTKAKIGLWIDLTNTTRFYDKSEVEGRNIRYVKMECRGHGECPNIDQTNMFIRICQQFISQHPLEIIGVHCTHGFNRTGFLIVAYLIESLSWGVEAAVHVFSQARPPGIYKADYLRELFKRYGDINDAPPAPPLPEWCNEIGQRDPYCARTRRYQRGRRGRPEFEHNRNRSGYSDRQQPFGNTEDRRHTHHAYRGDYSQWSSTSRRQDNIPWGPYPGDRNVNPANHSLVPSGDDFGRPFPEADMHPHGTDLGTARRDLPDEPVQRIGAHELSAPYSNYNDNVSPECFAERESSWQRSVSPEFDHSTEEMRREQFYMDVYGSSEHYYR